MRVFFFVFFAFITSSHLSAALVQVASGGTSTNGITKSATLTVQTDSIVPAPGLFTLTLQIVSSGSPGSGQTWVNNYIRVNGALISSTSQNSLGLLPAVKLGDRVQIGVWAQSGAVEYYYIDYTVVLPPKKYWVKFTIPYLATGRVDYYAMQNGALVGQHQVVAVMGQHVWTVGPLDTNDPVTLMQITGGNVGDDGTAIPVVTDDTVATPVSPPVVPGEGYDSSGASSGGSAGNGAGNPVNPTPDAPDVLTPTPSPGPPSVDPSPEPNPSPSGGDGATTADIQNQTNQIIAGLNKTSVNAQASASAVVVAIDRASGSATASANGIIKGLNNVKDAVDRGRAAGESSSATLKEIKGLLSSSGTETAPAAWSPETVDPVVVRAPSASILPTSAPTFFSGSFGAVSAVSASLPAISVAGKTFPSHVFTYDFAQHASAVSLIRGILSVALTIGFFIKCVQTIKGSSASEN